MSDLTERLIDLAQMIESCDGEFPIGSAGDVMQAAHAIDLSANKQLREQLNLIIEGVNRRCGVGPNELALVSVDKLVRERDEARKELKLAQSYIAVQKSLRQSWAAKLTEQNLAQEGLDASERFATPDATGSFLLGWRAASAFICRHIPGACFCGCHVSHTQGVEEDETRRDVR